MAVWTLILRGISIEFRSHVHDELWRAFWDRTFALASLLMPVLLGAALGNVVRGVPLDASGYFNIPLFTDFGARNPVGILDWFTVLIGVFALATVAAHGALFLAWKTDGPVHERSRALAKPLWSIVIGLWVAATIATRTVSPEIYEKFPTSVLAWLFFVVYLAGLATVFFGMAKRRYLLAFLGSGAFIIGILATTAACVWPVMLKSTMGPALSITAQNATVGEHGLQAGLGWWFIGFAIAVGYVAFLFKLHRGKVRASAEGEGY